GGAGKSTNAVHTAGALAQRGNTLFVDLDKHGGVTCAYGYTDNYYLPEGGPSSPTLYSSLMGALSTPPTDELVIDRDEFDLLPATEQFMSKSNINELSDQPRSYERLTILLRELDGYDYIVLDTPPDLNILSNNAIVAADVILMPFIPEKLNQNSLTILRKQIQGIGDAYPVNPVAVIASRVGDNNEHQDAIRAVDERIPFPLIVVRKTTHLSKAIDRGETIYTYSNESPQAERARETFTEIADLIDREGGE
ncbi:ParA family protein, partial [Cryptosporangium minutisporangium]|uniref:ParA family protein n=1 Tax=Cryptosporangium minutisporangium TaxID=113569 RepID=UPI0035E5D1DE